MLDIPRTSFKALRAGPPAMHSALGWCKYGFINQMVKLASHRFQGFAGRSNIEGPTSNLQHGQGNEVMEEDAESRMRRVG
jgi:hypothetical protein